MMEREQSVRCTSTATQWSELTAVTGETEREDLHKIATPPQPLERVEDSDKRLSEQPYEEEPGEVECCRECADQRAITNVW